MAGRKGWKAEFDAACMLSAAAGRLIKVENITPAEAKKDDFFSELEKEKRRIALEVFKKLAPNNVNIGGQPNNPLGISLEIVLHEDRSNAKTD